MDNDQKEFNDAQVTTHIDAMGVREGLIVAFVVGEGVNDAVLAKVVVFGKPVDNRIPLGAEMVLFDTPVKTELDVMFE